MLGAVPFHSDFKCLSGTRKDASVERCPIFNRRAVDGFDDVARLQSAECPRALRCDCAELDSLFFSAEPLPNQPLNKHGRRIVQTEVENKPERDYAEYQIDSGPGGDDKRTTTERRAAKFTLRACLLSRVLTLHHDVPAERQCREPVFCPAVFKPKQFRAEADREDVYLNARTLRGEKVPQFVDKD